MKFLVFLIDFFWLLNGTSKQGLLWFDFEKFVFFFLKFEFDVCV